MLLPPSGAPGFAGALLIACYEKAVDVVVPLRDAELLPIAAIRWKFAAAGVGVLAVSGSTASICFDRWKLFETCRHAGIGVPHTSLLESRGALDLAKGPCVIRARHTSGSSELVNFGHGSLLRSTEFDGARIVQEYVPGTEYSIDVLAYRDGHVASVVPRSNLQTSAGVSIASATVADTELENLGRAVAAALQLTSVASILVRRSTSGTPQVLGVTPRIPGGIPLSVAAGVNMPALALADLLCRCVPRVVGFREMAMVRFWDQHFVERRELHEAEVALAHCFGN